MRTALLVIDVQHLLCCGQYQAHDIERVLDNINSVIQRARAANVPVAFIQHQEAGEMEPGSAGWQLDARLARAAGDELIDKTTCDSFNRTRLQAWLETQQATRLVICGLQTDFCVDTTTRSALAHGYEVTLVADGHSTLDNGVLGAQQIIDHHNRTLASIGSYGVRVAVRPAAEVGF